MKQVLHSLEDGLSLSAKKNSIFKVLLLTCLFLSVAAFKGNVIAASLEDGKIYTIYSGSNYLAINSNGNGLTVVSSNTNNNIKWIAVKNGSQFNLQSMAFPGKYLSANSGDSNLGVSVSTTNNYSIWNADARNYGKSRYLYFNNSSFVCNQRYAYISNVTFKAVDYYILSVIPQSELVWAGDNKDPQSYTSYTKSLTLSSAGGNTEPEGSYIVNVTGMSSNNNFTFSNGKISPNGFNLSSNDVTANVTLTFQAVLNGITVAETTKPVTLRQKPATFVIQSLSAEDLVFEYNATNSSTYAKTPTFNSVVVLKKSNGGTEQLTDITYAVKSITNVTGTFKVYSTTKIYPTSQNTNSTLRTGTASVNVDIIYNDMVIGNQTLTVKLQQSPRVKILLHRNPYPASYTSTIEELQPTHENYRIVYAKPGTSKTLDASGADNYVTAYTRWFDYENEGGSLSNAGTATDKGYVTIGAKTTISYTLPSGSTSHKIACDVSDYQDYNNVSIITGNSYGTFTEPTLSYRWIFDVRDAREIIDKFNSLGANEYLEEYEITAPANQPSIILKPQFAASNYYGTNYSTGTFTWSSGYQECSVTGEMFYRFQGGVAGTTKTVTLTMRAGGITYRVARFVVKFIDDAAPMAEASLPASRNLSYLDNPNGDYVKLATLNFDNNEEYGNSGIATKPLGWNESSYGFYYRGLSTSSNDKKAGSNFPEWSEYAITRSAASLINLGCSYLTSGVVDHSNPTSGYFLYVDASEKPGTIANLKFDQSLCPNMRLKIVAYVANLHANSTGKRPNLNLILKGKSSDGSETVLNRFTTGEVPFDSKWHQICYDVIFNTNQDFDYYTLQVDNNGTSSQGNDFAIDDIRVYRTKTSVEAWQKGPECSNEVPIFIEIDEASLLKNLINGTGYLNYRFLDENNAVVACNYYNYNNDVASTFGTIKFENGRFVAPINDGIIQENGRITFVQSSANFQPGKRYYLVLNASLEPLNNPTFETDTRCGWSAEISSILSDAELYIDGELQASKTVENFCNNSIVHITAKITGTLNNRVVKVDCPFDWYIGKADDDIVALINNFQTNRVMTPEITALVNEGKLILDQVDIEYSILNDMIFTLFPIQEKATVDGVACDVELCLDPLEAKIFRGSGAGTLVFGERDITYPENYVLATRLSQEAANTGGFDVPIKEISSTITNISDVIIIESSDRSARIGASLFNSSIGFNSDKSYLHLVFERNDLFKEGYEYKLWISFSDGSVCGGSTNLRLKVVPDNVIWKGVNNDWNDDTNWGVASINGMAVAEVATSGIKGYVPMDFTNVTLPEKAGLPYPKLIESSTSNNLTVYGDDVKEIYYDYNFEGNVCKNIYFQPGAELARTDLLKKEKVWIDQRLNVNRWYMLSAPLQDMYTGDMHLPKDGVYNNTLFNDLDAANNRLSPLVYQQVFARTVANKMNTGASQTFIAGTDWSTPFNALNYKYEVGMGYRLGVLAEGYFPWIGDDLTVVFKFPKVDETYHYYTSYGAQSSLSEHVDKNNHYEFAFSPAPGTTSQTIRVSKEVESSNADVESTVFLVGNPFMSHLNFEKFYEANSSVISPKFWIYENSTDKIYSCIKDENDNWVYTSKEGYDLQINGNIAPMQSFFIEGNGEFSSDGDGTSFMQLDLVFNTDMMSLDNSVAAMLKTKAVSTNTDDKVLKVTANRGELESTMAVVCRADADNGYRKSEDALTLLDVSSDYTPVIYSVADNNALSITTVKGDVMVPLAIYTKAEGAVDIKFAGMDSFDYPIYLYDSQTETRTELTKENSDLVLNVEKTQLEGKFVGRYYLQFKAATAIEDVKESAINAYSPSEGVLMVQSEVSDPIASVEVYTTDGKLIASKKQVNDAIARFDIATDNYIVKIQTQNESVSIKVNVQ